jgi:hypothetical protein
MGDAGRRPSPLADCTFLAVRPQIGEQVHFTTTTSVAFSRPMPWSAACHPTSCRCSAQSIATRRDTRRSIPKDVIRHYRTSIGQQRLTRPSENTVARLLQSGKSSKALRQAQGQRRQLRPQLRHPTATTNTLAFDALCSGPTEQADWLREIITNLHARITEAEQNNWLGEVEGLKASLAGAQEKLEEMERLTADDGPSYSAAVIKHD